MPHTLRLVGPVLTAGAASSAGRHVLDEDGVSCSANVKFLADSGVLYPKKSYKLRASLLMLADHEGGDGVRDFRKAWEPPALQLAKDLRAMERHHYPVNQFRSSKPLRKDVLRPC